MKRSCTTCRYGKRAKHYPIVVCMVMSKAKCEHAGRAFYIADGWTPAPKCARYEEAKRGREAHVLDV